MAAGIIEEAERPEGPRRHVPPRFIPKADPTQARADRWFPANGFEPFAVPGPDHPRSDATAALEHALALTASAKATAAGGGRERRSRAATLHVLAADLRREAGEWALCAGNYEALTRYYLALRSYKPALAYMRRLVFVADLSAAPAIQIEAYLLAARVYRKVRDYVSAVDLATRAAKVAVEASDAAALARARDCMDNVHGALVARPGDRPHCACGAPLPYGECCKEADQVPAEFSIRAAGLKSQPFHPATSPWLSAADAGIDVIMRKPGPSGETPYWVAHGIADGRHTLLMLPNWSARAMQAARAMHAYSLEHAEGFEGPASAVLQVSSALDAFINSVLYFINHDEGARFWNSQIPAHRYKPGNGKNGGPLFARWKEIGEGLFGQSWSTRSRVDDLELLNKVRTALTHYKEDNIEQVAPTARSPHPLIAAFEGHADFDEPGAIRPGQLPWVDRLLTPHMAGWAIDLAEALITSFRDAWHEAAAKFDAANRADDGAESPYAA